jgi:hypothetical protein
LTVGTLAPPTAAALQEALPVLLATSSLHIRRRALAPSPPQLLAVIEATAKASKATEMSAVMKLSVAATAMTTTATARQMLPVLPEPAALLGATATASSL